MRKHFILVVEDDADLREAMVESLKDLGYEVQGATDGMDGLNKLRSRPHLPCVILLDLMMPILDGWQFRQELLQEQDLAAIPVIVLSAHADLGEVTADAHLRKPLTAATLTQAVARFCGPPVFG